MRFLLKSVLVVAMVLSCLGCRTVSRIEDTVMGPITARITVVSDGVRAEEIESAIRAALAEVHRIDALMSNYKGKSDVSRLNNSADNVWVQVDPMTFTVLKESQRFAELTAGAFDTTVFPLTRLWGFWPVKEARIPSDDEIQSTLSHVGYGKLSLDETTHSVRKSDARTQVDMGAIAKGYAVDRAMDVLRRREIADALVEIGGEARAIGTNKEGKLWRIGVLHPTKQGYLAVLELSNRAVATSGDYMNFFVMDGKRYSHLIDPRTGKPISNEVCSVTIVAENCTEADALATTISVMGREEGLKLIESLPGKEAIVVRRVPGEDGIEVEVSTGLKGLTIAP